MWTHFIVFISVRIKVCKKEIRVSSYYNLIDLSLSLLFFSSFFLSRRAGGVRGGIAVVVVTDDESLDLNHASSQYTSNVLDYIIFYCSWAANHFRQHRKPKQLCNLNSRPSLAGPQVRVNSSSQSTDIIFGFQRIQRENWASNS